jgi:PAS domain-containing protein
VQNVKENLAVFLDHVGDGVTVQDASGRLVYANVAAVRALEAVMDFERRR